MRISDWSSDVCSSDLRCHKHEARSPQIFVDRDDGRRQQPGQYENGAGEREAPDVPWCTGPTRERDAEETARHRGQRGQYTLGIPTAAQYQSREELPIQQSANSRTGRSEERRVGKECGSTGRSRWSPDHSKKKKIT